VKKPKQKRGFRFSAFVTPPAGSVLEMIWTAFRSPSDSARPLSDPDVLRPLVARALIRDGFSPKSLGQNGFRELVKVKTQLESWALLIYEMNKSPQAPGQPEGVLVALGVMTFLRNHKIARGRIDDALYATSTELGPGISIAEMQAAVHLFFRQFGRLSVKERKLQLVAMARLGEFVRGCDDLPINMTLTENEFCAIAGTLDRVNGLS
jgi:hypothetical protein